MFFDSDEDIKNYSMIVQFHSKKNFTLNKCGNCRFVLSHSSKKIQAEMMLMYFVDQYNMFDDLDNIKKSDVKSIILMDKNKKVAEYKWNKKKS